MLKNLSLIKRILEIVLLLIALLLVVINVVNAQDEEGTPAPIPIEESLGEAVWDFVDTGASASPLAGLTVENILKPIGTYCGAFEGEYNENVALENTPANPLLDSSDKEMNIGQITVIDINCPNWVSLDEAAISITTDNEAIIVTYMMPDGDISVFRFREK